MRGRLRVADIGMKKYFGAPVRADASAAHTLVMKSREPLMQLSYAFDALREKTPAAQALALKLVTQSDLLRLKVIARLHARGLPPEVGWTDLLQEAFAATDEEILAAAGELGMNPAMRGSAAFFSVTLLVQPNFLARKRGKAMRSRVAHKSARNRSDEL